MLSAPMRRIERTSSTGFFFLVFPIYTGYYLVTRFDELWPWFALGTVGFLLSFAGARALQLSGML